MEGVGPLPPADTNQSAVASNQVDAASPFGDPSVSSLDSRPRVIHSVVTNKLHNSFHVLPGNSDD